MRLRWPACVTTAGVGVGAAAIGGAVGRRGRGDGGRGGRRRDRRRRRDGAAAAPAARPGGSCPDSGVEVGVAVAVGVGVGVGSACARSFGHALAWWREIAGRTASANAG